MTNDEILRLAIELNLIGTINRDGIYADALIEFAKKVEEICAKKDAK